MLRSILFFFVIVFLLFSACKSDVKNNSTEINNPVKVDVPEVFKNDSIITNHLTELSANLGKFSVIIEDLADGIDAVGIKDINKPTIIEKIQLMKIVLPKVEPALVLIKNLQELDLISEKIKDTLPINKKNAFVAFEKNYKNKFDTLNLRFKKYANTESEN